MGNQTELHKPVQYWAAACGPIAMIMAGVGFIMAHFLPPPEPSRGVVETVAFLTAHANAIRAGLLIMCLSGGTYILFSVLLTMHLNRVEGHFNILSIFQVVNAALVGFIVIFPNYYWFYALFRPRSPEIMILLNDMGWITFGGFIWNIFWQYVAVAVIVLRDRSNSPIFPRWYGYFTVSVAVGVLPAGLNMWFLDGPMAWNGALSWWLEVTMIASWSYTTFFVLLGVIRRQGEAEAFQNRHVDGAAPQ